MKAASSSRLAILLGSAIVVGAGLFGLAGLNIGGGRGRGSGEAPREAAPPATPAMPSPAPAQAPTPSPTPVARPLEVVIRGADYYVEGKACELEAVLELAAQVPAGDGPAVLAILEDSSQAMAEVKLRNKLAEAGLGAALVDRVDYQGK